MATKIKVNPDIRVFAVYSALNGLGYDLGMNDSENPPNPIRIKVAQEIDRRISGNKLFRNYFEHACLRGAEVVNPFWPRSYLLLLTSFHLNEPPNFQFIQDGKKKVIDFIRGLPIEPEERGRENIEWILQLPEIIRKFWSEAQPEDLWEEVAEESLSVGYQSLESANHGYKLFKRRFNYLNDGDIPDIVIVPNLLQTPETLDVVKVKNVIYLVTARLNSSDVIHELLHEVLEPLLRIYQELIDRHANLLETVWPDMRRMQYAAGDKLSAWRRVFEENIVRTATIWVDSESDVPSAQRSMAEVSYGFIFVPLLLESLNSHWAGLENFEEFLVVSLERLSQEFPTV